MLWRGALAQLVERLVRNEKVSGSIPLCSTTSLFSVIIGFPGGRICGAAAGMRGKVPGTGLEPAHLTILDPKSSASTNSAIPAGVRGF